MTPGEIIPADGQITLNAGRSTVNVDVANTGDRPIQVGSHFHFYEVNRALRFARDSARGYGRSWNDLAPGATRRGHAGRQQ